MSGQTKLAAFSEDSPKPPKPAYNCWTCLLKLDIIIQAGRQKVKCKGVGLRDFRDSCSSWTSDLVRCLRQSQQCINKSLASLLRHGEISYMPRYRDAIHGLWVAV